MKIGINGLSLSNRSGTGYYAQNLILALSQLEPRHEYHLFLPEDCLLTLTGRGGREGDEEAVRFGRRLRPILSGRPHVHAHLVSRRNRLGRIAWEQIYLPQQVRRLGLDVLHSPTGIAPLRLGEESVVTLHDLAYLRYPELFTRSHGYYLRQMLSRSAARASAVITDSETVRKEIAEELSISSKKIKAIPLGVDSLFHPIEEEEPHESLRKSRDLPEEFILALGTVEPRKNLLVLIDAFEKIRKEEPQLGLVLVGRRGWKEEPVFEKIERMNLWGSIRWTGFLPRESLPVIYSMASVCASLSVYEGFGLPALEAMACGAPVVLSDIPVYREWAGRAAEFTDPHDPEAVAETLLRLYRDRDAQQRQRAEGLELAGKLTWECCARETVAVYEKGD
jgi:glycosyltransferase involved in cell wall biosynthesis